MMGAGIEKDRVAIYIRWSTDDQADGTTLEVQLEACKLFIQSQGWTVRNDLIFVDDGCSGSTLDRPSLRALREAVAEGNVSCVVVYKLDRLSRSVLDTVTLVLREWEGVCSVRSTREPIDTSNPTGSILFYMLASYAEWERSTIRERTMSGKIKRAQQGKNPGFSLPYGYARGAEPGQLVIDEGEAALVRRIFREYIAGRGIHLIAAGLNQDGIRPRRATRWQAATIAKMIANPVYKGVLRYGCSTLTTPAQRKQIGKLRVFHDARFAYVEGAVPAIIPPLEFDRAQRVKKARQAMSGFRNRGSEFLLTGIARCKCGATVRGDGRGKTTGARYYRCSGTTADNPGRCDCALMRVEQLEEAVLSQVRAALAPGNRELLLASWQEETRRRSQGVEAEAAQIKAKLALAEKSRARLYADYRAGDLLAKLYATHAEELDGEVESLTASLQTLSDDLDRLKAAQMDLAGFEDLASQIDSWAVLQSAEQKQLLRHVISRCVVYRQSARGKSNPIEVDLQLRRFA